MRQKEHDLLQLIIVEDNGEGFPSSWVDFSEILAGWTERRIYDHRVKFTRSPTVVGSMEAYWVDYEAKMAWHVNHFYRERREKVTRWKSRAQGATSISIVDVLATLRVSIDPRVNFH